MNETSQIDDQTYLGPFAPGDEERFRTNALVTLVAFASLSLLAMLAFLLLF